MRAPDFFRIVIVGLALALPLSSAAEASGSAGYLSKEGIVFSDRQEPARQDDKKPDDRKPEDRKPDDRKPEGRKPDIKEVPRSRQLPKPTAVIGRGKIKRPPVRVPRPVGRGRGNLRLL